MPRDLLAELDQSQSPKNTDQPTAQPQDLLAEKSPQPRDLLAEQANQVAPDSENVVYLKDKGVTVGYDKSMSDEEVAKQIHEKFYTIDIRVPKYIKDSSGITSEPQSVGSVDYSSPIEQAKYPFERIISATVEKPAWGITEGALRGLDAIFKYHPSMQADFDIAKGMRDQATGFLNKAIDFYGQPEKNAYFTSSAEAKRSEYRKINYQKNFAVGIASDLSESVTDLMGFMLQLGAVKGAQGISELSKATDFVGQFAKEAGTTAGYGFATSHGGISDRIQTALGLMAYNMTPYIANATGAIGLKAASIAAALNVFINTPTYSKALQSAGGVNKEFLAMAIPQFVMDAGFAIGVKGLPENVYKSKLTNYVRGRMEQMNLPEAEAQKLIFALKETLNDSAKHGTLPTNEKFVNDLKLKAQGKLVHNEVFEKFYQHIFNRFASIENAVEKAKALGYEVKPGEDPGISARAYLAIGGKAGTMLEDNTFKITPEGKIEITGEGFKPILSDYNKRSPEKNAKAREQDLSDYLISKRYVSDLQRTIDIGGETKKIATEEQTQKSIEKLNELDNKYGNGISLLEETANRIYDYQKRVLHLLVDSGNMSQEQYDGMVNANQHYVPFDRVLETESGSSLPKNKNRFSSAKSPVKKIKGSEKEVHNPLESIIKNTYVILDRAERNKVASQVASLADILPEEISPVNAKMVPVAQEKFAVQVDPVLKAKLTQTIKNLQGTFEQKFGIGGKRLGYYVHPQNEIVTKVGSREDVLAHELGHFLDFNYGLADKLTADKETNKELRRLADKRYEGVPVSEHFKKYVREKSEKVAALVDAYITKPYLLDEYAPKSKAIIKDLIDSNPELLPLRDARPSMVTQTEEFTKTIFRESPFVPKGNVIEYFSNGDRKFIEVSPNLYEAMRGMTEESLNLMTKILSLPASTLRVGATITPEFIGRNFLRDQWTALMQTRFGFMPFVDSSGAIADVVGRSDVYKDWLRSGGAYASSVELSRPALKKAYEELMGNHNLLKKLNIITDLQDMSQVLEQATRVGAFTAARRKGMSDAQAGFESRESTLDFSRRGSKTKNINATVAFFNAGLQSFDKTLRVAAADPVGFTLKGIAAITVPSVVSYLLNRNDPEYEQIPRWQKDLFWIFKVNGTFVRFPKPFAYGQLFGSLTERFLEYADKGKTDFKSGLNSLIASLSPISVDPEKQGFAGLASGLIPTALKPIIENQANYSFFTDRKIVSSSRENLIDSEQYQRYTSLTSKNLGKLIGYSPAKLDNYVRGYLGGSGQYTLNATDSLIRGITGEKDTRPKELADVPFVKGFVVRDPEGSGSESVNKFYDNKKEIDALYATRNKLSKEGRHDEAMKLNENEKLRLHSFFSGVADSINSMSERIDRISNSDMSMKYKKESIDDLEKRMTEIAKRANERLKS